MTDHSIPGGVTAAAYAEKAGVSEKQARSSLEKLVTEGRATAIDTMGGVRTYLMTAGDPEPDPEPEPTPEPAPEKSKGSHKK
jgi:hypothetical protein